MKRFFALLLMIGLVSTAHAGDGSVRLTLTEAVTMAVEKNLEARAELYSVAQSEAVRRRSLAIFEPVLSSQTLYDYTPTDPVSAGATEPAAPGATVSSSGSGDTDGQKFQFNTSLSQLLRTGGTIAAVFNNSYADSTVPGSSLDRYWLANAGVSYTQPLLKNFGRENTEIEITVSRIAKTASLEHFKSRLTLIVSQVRTEYFKLYRLRQTLQVRQASLGLARKILGETQSRFKAGVIPASEILNAEFGVASREKDLNDAEKLAADQVDVLRLLLQLPAGADITPVDAPLVDSFEVDEAEKIRRAMNRHDIQERRKSLEISELQARINQNRIKPDLSVKASSFVTSLDDDYLGSVEETPTWSVGLNFSYPIGNAAARNDYRKSRLEADQIALQIKQLEENAANEVRAAIRAIIVNRKQIEVTERGTAFAEERFRAFTKKNENGLATTKDVLDAERDLMEAKNNRIQASADHIDAVTRLWAVTGELIERSGIRIAEEDADALYLKVR